MFRLSERSETLRTIVDWLSERSETLRTIEDWLSGISECMPKSVDWLSELVERLSTDGGWKVKKLGQGFKNRLYSHPTGYPHSTYKDLRTFEESQTSKRQRLLNVSFKKRTRKRRNVLVSSFVGRLKVCTHSPNFKMSQTFECFLKNKPRPTGYPYSTHKASRVYKMNRQSWPLVHSDQCQLQVFSTPIRKNGGIKKNRYKSTLYRF